MGLTARRRAALPFETWPVLISAADIRFWDAMALATSEQGHEAGAIYLLGYVAEIMLKAAYCQYNLLPATQNVYLFLRPQSLTVHEVTALANALIDTRSQSSSPMDTVAATQLAFHAAVIDSHRHVEMRYYDFAATEAELAEVYASVDWIRTNYQKMWS